MCSINVAVRFIELVKVRESAVTAGNFSNTRMLEVTLYNELVDAIYLKTLSRGSWRETELWHLKAVPL